MSSYYSDINQQVVAIRRIVNLQAEFPQRSDVLIALVNILRIARQAQEVLEE